MIALLVVVAHMVLGEMVPRNIALAGPERAALLLVPPFLLFITAVRPAIALFNRLASGVLRLLRVRPRDELRGAFTRGELAELIAESQREGLLDAAESVRLTRTLSAIGTTVSDVLVPRDELVSLPPQPRVGDVTAAVAATGFSRFPVRSPADGTWTGYLHVKDVLDLLDADPPDLGPPAPAGTDAAPATTPPAALPSPRNASADCPRCAPTPGSTPRWRPCATPAPTSPGPSTPAARPSAWSPSRTWSRRSWAPSATQRTDGSDRPLVGRSDRSVVLFVDGVVD